MQTWHPIFRCGTTIDRKKPMCRTKRSAFTLVELAVVMAVIGGIAVVAVSMTGNRQVLDSLAARQQAAEVASTLRFARTAAVANNSDVQIEAMRSGRRISGLRVITGATPIELVGPLQEFPETLDVQWSVNQITFHPSGMADRSLQIEFSDAKATWRVQVLAGSGQVVLN